jgi:adenylate cyclase
LTLTAQSRALLKCALTALASFVFDWRTKGALPERIRRDIERQQEAGEIIVGWTQVAAVVFFAVVYAISPKAFPAGTPFEPVPWTLGIYGLFTAGGLVLAYRGRLSRGFVAISVVVDILVLMLTIWSFHLLVSGTARALLESADSDVRLHLDRIADTAVRARLRAARRRVRGFGLADAVPLCGVGIARGGVHAQLRRICHIVHNPTPRLGRT